MTPTTDNRQAVTQEMPAVEMVENIYQVRLPLPFALNHVNCYVLRDDDGWTILDTGLNRPEIQATWQRAFDQLEIEPTMVRQIIVSHMHPDHFGLAGWFQQLTGAPVLMSPREQALARHVWFNDGWNADDMTDYWYLAGIVEDIRDVVTAATTRLRSATMPLPAHIADLASGSSIRLAGRDFRTIHAPGHSDGQLIFYDQSDRLLLSADQVLMKITPNIGLWPETEPDPLGRYLDSLRSLLALDVTLALPGHRNPIEDWQRRLNELLIHHDTRLAHVREAAGAGRTGLEVAHRVFDFSRFTEHEVRFAVAETMSHLEYLADRNEIKRVEGEVRRYRVS